MSKGQIITACIVCIGFIGVTLMAFFFKGDLPEWATQIVVALVGALIVNFTTIINWQFGSSKGSSDKTQLLIDGK